LREVLEHLVQLAKDSFIYGVAQIGNAFVGLFLLPIYTRVFSPSEYGVIDIILPTTALLTIIAELRIGSGVARYYYENEGEQRRSLLSTGLFLYLAFPLPICLCCFFFTGQISQALFSSQAYGWAISLALFTVLLGIFSSYFLLILRFQRATVKYGILAVGKFLLGAALCIYFVVYLHKGIEGVFLGLFLAELVFTAANFLMIRKNLAFSFSRLHARNTLYYGVPLTPTGLVGWFRTHIHRFLLIPLIGLAGVGIFGSAARISSVILIINASFNLAWAPFAMSVLHDKNHRIIYSKVLTYYTTALSAATLVVTFFAYELVHLLMPSNYWGASDLVGLLATAQVLNGIFVLFAIGLLIAKKTYLNSVSFLIGVAAGIVCLMVLVPHIGVMGAAIATLVSSAISVVAAFYLAQRNYHIDYEIKRVMGIILLLIIAIPMAIFTDGISDNLLRIGLKLIELIVLFFGLWMCLPRGEVVAGLKIISQGVLREGLRSSFLKIWRESEK
jgi:O-antigen/teichoic acid export membrane protein